MRWLIPFVVIVATGCTRPAPWAGVDWTDGGDPGLFGPSDPSHANEAGLLDNRGDGGPVAPEVKEGDGGAAEPGQPGQPQPGQPQPGPGVPPTPTKAKKRVFITSAEYDGDLRSLIPGATSGLAAADALCATAAKAAALGGSSWVAWVSSDKLDALDRLKDVGPWYRLDGVKAFNNKTHLVTVPLVGLGVDEHGREVHRFEQVWTGTRSGGRAGLTCQGFTSSDPFDQGVVGGADDDDSGWTDDWKDSCVELNHLICFEQ